MKEATLAPVSPSARGAGDHAARRPDGRAGGSNRWIFQLGAAHSITSARLRKNPLLLLLFLTHAGTHFFFFSVGSGGHGGGSVMWPDVQVDTALKAFDWMKQCIGCG